LLPWVKFEDVKAAYEAAGRTMTMGDVDDYEEYLPAVMVAGGLKQLQGQGAGINFLVAKMRKTQNVFSTVITND
jgi:hypothetical protein